MKPPFISKYSIQNYLKAEEGFIDAYENNFDHWYIDGSLESDNHNKWNIKRINYINQLIHQYNVTPIFHSNFKIPLASDVDELKSVAISYIKKEIDLAHNLNSPLIIHGGAIIEPRLINSTKKKCLQSLVHSIEQILNYAISKKVNVYLENLSNYIGYGPFHYILTTIDEFHYLIDRIPEIKLFIDIGHANINNNPIEFFKQFHKQTVGMSFSNNNGNNDQHLSLMKGTIDYKTIVAEIIKVNWVGIISFETRGRKPADSANDLAKIYIDLVNTHKNNVA